MHRSLRPSSIAALTVAALASSPASAQTGDPDSPDARLARLEAEIARLEAARNEDVWLTEARAAEVRDLVQDVIADADTRAGFLTSSQATAGWDGHPFIASADGNFRLDLETRMQIRYVLNIQDEDPGVEDTTRGGFEMRRIRSIFSGHVVDPSITYKVQATFNRSGGPFILEDAFIQKEFDNGVYLLAGQFRGPLTREVIVSTFRTTAVERAIAHGAIELSRSQGVEVGWQGERFLLRGALQDGDGNANTPSLAEDAEFSVSARAEALAAGAWKQFRDFTGWRGDDFGLLLGAGVFYERGEFGTDNPGRVDDFRWTVDASAEFSGAHLYGAIGGREIDPDTGDDLDILIAVLQGGVFITDDIEGFARFEWGDEDSGDDDSDDDLLILTIGGTKYWNRHDLKWTTDVGYAFDAVSGTFASSGAGWREDPSDTDGQIVIRSQLQLCF